MSSTNKTTVKQSGIRLMSRLAAEYGAVNLSQGFPNEAPPPEGIVAVVCALLGGSPDAARDVGNLQLSDLASFSRPAGPGEASTPGENQNGKNAATLAEVLRQVVLGRNRRDAFSQYSVPFGRQEIRRSIERYYERSIEHYYERWYPGAQGFLGREGEKNIDAEKNITVTLGATEAFAVAYGPELLVCDLRAVCEPNDAVLIMEPYHELYPQQAAVFHLKYELTALKEDRERKTWVLDWEDFEQKMKVCKALVLCDPHNPTGKIFAVSELRRIARLCLDNDVYLFTDDIYEHMLFLDQEETVDSSTDAERTSASPRREEEGRLPRKHLLAGLDTATVLTREAGFSDADVARMRERTLVMNSVSKSFSCTGWRVGWLISHESLTERVRAVHDQMVLQAPTPLQLGVEALLDHLDADYYRKLRAKYKSRRDFLVGALRELGFAIEADVHAAYYVLAKYAAVAKLQHFETAHEACMFLLKTCGVASVAGDTFFEGAAGKEYIRFCFCRQMDDLEEAVNRLKKHLA